MSDKKYELTNEIKTVNGVVLHRIRALKDFKRGGIVDVEAGEIGGWIETEKNLSHEGGCWVFDDGMVLGNGLVSDNSMVSGNGMVSGHGWISDYGWVRDNGLVCDCGMVSGHGRVFGSGIVSGNGLVSVNGRVSGHGMVSGHGVVSNYGRVSGNGVVKSADDILTIGPIGSQDDFASFYRLDNGGIGVTCGCFTGDIDEFSAKVIKTHLGSKYETDYLAAIEFAKIKIGSTMPMDEGGVQE